MDFPRDQVQTNNGGRQLAVAHFIWFCRISSDLSLGLMPSLSNLKLAPGLALAAIGECLGTN